MPSRRGVTGASLVVAPALLVADNLLHPKEYPARNEAKQLEAIADAYERWQVAHVLGFLGIVVFAAAVLGLASLLHERRPRAALWGGGLGVAGLIGFAGVITLDGFTWGVLGDVSSRPGVDARTVELTLDEIQNSAWSLPYYLLGAAFIAGMIVLAVGSARTGLISSEAGALLAVAALMTGTETVIVSNAYFIAGALVLLAAGIAAALSLHESPAPAAG
jgi:hypothetical protein